MAAAKAQPTTVRFPAALFARVSEAATREHRSFNSYVLHVLESWLDEDLPASTPRRRRRVRRLRTIPRRG